MLEIKIYQLLECSWRKYNRICKGIKIVELQSNWQYNYETLSSFRFMRFDMSQIYIVRLSSIKKGQKLTVKVVYELLKNYKKIIHIPSIKYMGYNTIARKYCKYLQYFGHKSISIK